MYMHCNLNQSTNFISLPDLSFRFLSDNQGIMNLLGIYKCTCSHLVLESWELSAMSGQGIRLQGWLPPLLSIPTLALSSTMLGRTFCNKISECRKYFMLFYILGEVIFSPFSSENQRLWRHFTRSSWLFTKCCLQQIEKMHKVSNISIRLYGSRYRNFCTILV